MSEKTSTIQRNRHIFIFLMLTSFAVGTLFFAGLASAQQSNTAVVSNVRGRGNYNGYGNYNAPPPLPKTTVRGRAVYEDTGRPVRRATVMLLPSAKGSGVGEKSGLTNDSGEFSIKDVEAGNYFPMVNAPGVLNFLAYIDMSEARGEQEKLVEKTRLNFEEITVPSGGEIDIYVRARKGGAIGGRIMYANGDPAIGVKVEVMRKEEEQYTGVVSNFGALASMMFGGGIDGRTDDRGIYRVSGLPPGEYVVRVSEPAIHSEEKNSPGGMFRFMEVGGLGSLIRTFHPDANDVKNAAVLRVEPGQELSEINVIIPERSLFNIEGKIVAKGTQNPIAGARINILRKDATVSFFDRVEAENGEITSGSQGEWKLKEFPAGTYTVVVTPPSNYRDVEYDEQGNAKPNQTPQPKFAKVEKEIVITDENLTELAIEMPYGGSINGIINVEGDKQLPNMRISAVDEKGETTASAQIETFDYKTKTQRQKFEFKLENLSPGKFSIAADTNPYKISGSTNAKEIYYVKSIKSGAKDMLTAPFDLGEGGAINNVTIILAADGGRIKGVVKEKDNRPAVSRRILLVPAEASRRLTQSQFLSATTNNKGEFETEGAPLEYFVIFLTGKSKFTALDENWIRERSANADKVTIKANGETTVNLTAP